MQKKNAKPGKPENVIVVKKMHDYSDDPFFKKKAEDAKAFLKKHGLFEKLAKGEL